MTAFVHQQGGSIDMHMSDNTALALQRSQVQAVTYPINMQIATRHNALGEGTGMGIGAESDPAFTLLRDHHHAIGTRHSVRRLTPRECERLQGFPDDYTLIPHGRKLQGEAKEELARYFERTGQYIKEVAPNCYEFDRKRFESEWPKLAADGPRYKALGNSMAVPVMRWIGERINQVRTLDVMRAAA